MIVFEKIISEFIPYIRGESHDRENYNILKSSKDGKIEI